MDWRRHDGGPNPHPGGYVDLIWGIGVVEHQSAERVNWSFKWEWKPSGRSQEGTPDVNVEGPGRPSNTSTEGQL